jgi:hypothetical protein
MLTILFVLCAFGGGIQEERQAGSLTAAQIETAQAAIDVLPIPHVQVALVDPARDLAPNVAAAVRELDGFTLKSDAVHSYINIDGEIFRRAQAGQFYRYALAAVIWHERAHLNGADEAQAMKAEEDLWKTFVRDGRVDMRDGLRYLDVMKRRKRDK